MLASFPAELSEPRDLADLKVEASALVQHISNHPEIPFKVKQSFSKALAELLQKNDARSFLDIATSSAATGHGVPWRMASICVSCVGLQKQIDELNVRLSGYEDNERSAVRRQIAINIEYEIKAIALTHLPDYQDKCKNFRPFQKEKYIMDLDVYGIVDALKEENRRQICEIFHQEDIYPLLETCVHLKSFSDGGAHPTKYKKQPVTLQVASDIVSDPELRKERRGKSVGSRMNEEALKRLVSARASSAVVGLWEIRKQEGHSDNDSLLYSL